MKTLFPALLLVTASLCVIAAPQTPRGPLSKAEVLELLKAGVPSSVIAEVILRNGISFEPTLVVLNEVRMAGADYVVTTAMQESWRWESKKPLNDEDIVELVGKGMPGPRIASLIEQRRIGFELTEEFLQELRSRGAKDEIVDALRTSAGRPFSKDYLLQLLAGVEDAGQIQKGVKDRGIDFQPTEEDLGALRAAGASESLLQTIREAKRFKVAYASCPPLQPGGSSVFSSPNDRNTVVAHLQLGDRVMIEEKDSGKNGIDKISLPDGTEGFVQDSCLSNSIPHRYTTTTPYPSYRPEPPYSPQARHNKIQGTVTLRIEIDAQGNVTNVQEVSKPLGEGLDENAIKTVKTWKFRPATRDGVPVSVRIIAEITFRLFH